MPTLAAVQVRNLILAPLINPFIAVAVVIVVVLPPLAVNEELHRLLAPQAHGPNVQAKAHDGICTRACHLS